MARQKEPHGQGDGTVNEYQKAALFLVCVIATLMTLLFVSCTSASVYEPDCSDPFNMCARDSLLAVPGAV